LIVENKEKFKINRDGNRESQKRAVKELWGKEIFPQAAMPVNTGFFAHFKALKFGLND
jgi:hypothetical protein